MVESSDGFIRLNACGFHILVLNYFETDFMKLFYSEYIKDYSSYTFSYVPYAVYRAREEMSEIYDAGFLPYTGNVDLDHYLYYKARSVRIDLATFEPGSENRRVQRKFENLNVEVNWVPVTEFDREDEGFVSFCSDYSRQRFKGGEMEADRLEYILGSPFLTDIVVYNIEGKRAGYVFVGQNEDLVHYWYSFYELEDFQDLPLGKFMMLDMIRQSKETGRKHCYLGTCYGAHSLYKVRDFKGVEYSEGSRWSSDVKRLKEWTKSDDEPLASDRFKQLSPEDANAYVDSLINQEGS